MLAAAIALYVLATLAVGWWASRRVQTAEDYLLAGRQLPLVLATATVFATWFGAETILGVSAEVAREGLRGAVVDPLGAALCLLLVGWLFARPLYRRRLLTFGDLYRNAFGPRAETAAALLLVISYLGWVAGQFVALGLLAELVLGLPLEAGVVGGCMVVVAYTWLGGMWAIAWLDLAQNIVLVAGLALTLGMLAADLQPTAVTLPPDFFNPLPRADWLDGLAWMASLATIGLGSIPQQDVFQRVMAARTEGVAAGASVLGGLLYLTVGLLPVILAVLLRLHQPESVGLGAEQVDPQQAIPRYILGQLPPAVGVLFVGALLSAILSTCSAALLAPAAIVAENLIAPWVGGLKGTRLLAVSRSAVLAVAAVALTMALSRSDIHALVSESSAFSLVCLFVPMLAALYGWRLSENGALASMGLGLGVWLAASWAEAAVPPLLLGLGASALPLFGALRQKTG